MKGATIYYQHHPSSKWIKEGNSLIKREDKKIPSWNILQNEHFHVLHQAFRRERGFVLYLCTLPQRQCRERRQQPETVLICCSPPSHGSLMVGCLPWCPRLGLPALLWLSPSNLRVLHSRGPLSRPEHLGCLFWTQPTKQNGTWVIAHLPRLAPSQQSIGATTALHPICTLQGSRDSWEALQPFLYRDPDLTGSPMPSHSPWTLLTCSDWERGFPSLRNPLPRTDLSPCSSTHRSVQS